VGIGFVLIVWAFLLAVLAVPAMLVLLAVAHRTGGRARAKRVFRWAVVAAPLAAAYAGAGFLAYAFWCSAVRDVDPGIGDSWSVPLGRGFSLSFIDDTDQAAIYARHETDGVPLVPEITQIGQSGLYVYGLDGADSAFVLDTESGQVRRSMREGLPAALHEVGVVGNAVEPVGDFYNTRRWGWPDLLAVVVIGVPVLLFGGRSFQRAWNGADDRPA
jgi:hypothetical protein